MTTGEAPDDCGEWMPRTEAYCGRRPGHTKGHHRSRESIAKANARSNATNRQRYDERQAWLDDYKMARGCIDCGYRKHPKALDFDHLDPTLKSAGIADMVRGPWQAVLDEITKTVVRCANCHRIRTHESPAYREESGGAQG